MAPHDRSLRAAEALDPFRQGDLDGLCGLYAIVNAIRLVIFPTRQLNRSQLRPIFAAGLAALGRQRRLRFALAHGIVEETWHRVFDAMIAEANRRITGKLVASAICRSVAPLDTRTMLRQVTRSIREGRPVLITLSGSYNHWTVVSGYTATRFILFDSSQYRWIQIRSIGADNGRSSKPHLVSPTTIIALTYEH